MENMSTRGTAPSAAVNVQNCMCKYMYTETPV